MPLTTRSQPDAGPIASFEPTRWSLVARARGGDEAQRRIALESLCNAYWYPLYAFLRRSGRGVEDAEDLVQEFFVRLLDGSLLEGADPTRGKFRTLLLTSVRHLDHDAYRAANRQKRGGGVEFVHIDGSLAEDRWLAESSLATSPEAAFDRAWATAILNRAGERLCGEYSTPDQSALFQELSPRLTGMGADEGLAAIAERLGRTEAAVKMALSRMRRGYAAALRTEIAETVGSRQDVDGELRYLLTIIS